MKNISLLFVMLILIPVWVFFSPQSSSSSCSVLQTDHNQIAVLPGISTLHAYPPAVGILSNAVNCLNCHIDNGPWKDNDNLIIDIIDKQTQKSFKQPDGSFLIDARRGEKTSLLTVIGYKKDVEQPMPERNAWLYIDPATIGNNTLSKFAPGWDVDLPMSCRITGDNLSGYENAKITCLPMTILPLESARNAQIDLQVMLTSGESVKAIPSQGMLGNYFVRKVTLRVQ